jgi:hypothetical protein
VARAPTQDARGGIQLMTNRLPTVTLSPYLLSGRRAFALDIVT